MMDTPLLVRHLAERAETLFGPREIVSATASGVERSTYAEVVERARRLASALTELGVRPGDRVASFGWNSLRHLELYLAVPSMGAVLHTLNIRLFEDDLHYIVGHAQDKVIFLDASLAETMPRFEGVEHEVLMPDCEEEREGAIAYEELLESGGAGLRVPGPRRERGGGHVLHERHHRAAQGRRLLASLDRPAHPRGQPGRLDRPARERHADAGRADVPRDGLGAALRGGDVRRATGLSRPAHDAAAARRADRRPSG